MESRPRVHAIREQLDVFDARRAVRELAEQLSFPRRACEELAIVVSELATNILKHGVSGQIALRAIDDEARGVGIEITAEDRGPRIPDLPRALQDGHTTQGPLNPAKSLGRPGIGAGLGAIVRLSDGLRYEATETGNRFEVVRYRRPARSPSRSGSRGS